MFWKLRGLIRAKYGTQENFATALEISAATLNYKLNGNREFTVREMKKAIALLGIDKADVYDVFFESIV